MRRFLITRTSAEKAICHKPLLLFRLKIGGIYNLIKGKKYPDFVPQNIPVVDQSNVADYVEKWKNANTVEGAFKAFGKPPVQPLA
jgi:hypothetical protein